MIFEHRRPELAFSATDMLTRAAHRAEALSGSPTLGDMTTEELEDAAQDAREELEKLRENEGALTRDATATALQ